MGWGMHTKFDDLGRFADPSLLILVALLPAVSDRRQQGAGYE